jgi:hypothetical protein
MIAAYIKKGKNRLVFFNPTISFLFVVPYLAFCLTSNPTLAVFFPLSIGWLLLLCPIFLLIQLIKMSDLLRKNSILWRKHMLAISLTMLSYLLFFIGVTNSCIITA